MGVLQLCFYQEKTKAMHSESELGLARHDRFQAALETTLRAEGVVHSAGAEGVMCRWDTPSPSAGAVGCTLKKRQKQERRNSFSLHTECHGREVTSKKSLLLPSTDPPTTTM